MCHRVVVCTPLNCLRVRLSEGNNELGGVTYVIRVKTLHLPSPCCRLRTPHPPTHHLCSLQSAKANNGLGGETYINRYDASIVETEEESAFVSKMFEPKMPVVINEQERNKWGSPRGYKVSREQAATWGLCWGLCVGRRWWWWWEKQLWLAIVTPRQ